MTMFELAAAVCLGVVVARALLSSVFWDSVGVVALLGLAGVVIALKYVFLTLYHAVRWGLPLLLGFWIYEGLGIAGVIGASAVAAPLIALYVVDARSVRNVTPSA